jgi:hypothetical protein
MTRTPLPTPAQATVRCAVAAIAAAACLAAAGVAVIERTAMWIVLALGVVAVVPTVLAVCGLPVALLVLRVHRVRHRRFPPLAPWRRRALADLRRDLADLPETGHPIGL